MSIDRSMKRGAAAVLLAALAAGAVLAGCSASKTTKGAVIGGGTGAVIGGAAGGGKGAAIGAGVGALAGGIIGHYMDQQEKELQTVDGAKVEREGDVLKVTFDSAILFDVNKTDLKAVAETNLTKVAGILNDYPETNLLIEGHTDSQGTDAYNQTLSERRADAVKAYLLSQGVAPARLKAKGYGEGIPIATNDTPEGRSQNRRVEVKIEANEELKEKAAAEEKKG